MPKRAFGGWEAENLAPKEFHLIARGRVDQAVRHLEGVMPRTLRRERILRRPDLLEPSDLASEAITRAIREYREAFEELAGAFNNLPATEQQALVPRGITLLYPGGGRAEPKRLYIHWDTVAKGLDAYERRQESAQDLEESGEDWGDTWLSMDEPERQSHGFTSKQTEYLDYATWAIKNFVEQEFLGKNPAGYNTYTARDEDSARQHAEQIAANLNEVFERALANGDRITVKTLAHFLSLSDEHRKRPLSAFFKQYGAELNIP